MKDASINIPKKKSVILSVILCLITLGIYSYFWFLKRASELNNLQTKTKPKKGLIVTAFTLYILSAVFYLGMWITAIVKNENIATVNISQVPLLFQILFGVLATLLLVHTIVYILMAFDARKVLNESLVNKGVKRNISGLFTFFFNFLYLQYEINRIIDDTEMEKRAGPWTWFIILYILPIITGLTLWILDFTEIYSLPI